VRGPTLFLAALVLALVLAAPDGCGTSDPDPRGRSVDTGTTP
jgi:hypothetical protein